MYTRSETIKLVCAGIVSGLTLGLLVYVGLALSKF